MDENWTLILTIALPFYTALGFLAHNKYSKFLIVSRAIWYICIGVIVLGATWDIATTYVSYTLHSDIDADYLVKDEISEIIDKNRLKMIYWFFIPAFTFLYLTIIQYIFTPEKSE